MPPVLQQLKLETLDQLDDGRVAIAFAQNLKSIIQDCMDRPGDKRPRKVTLVLSAVPQVANDGSCEGISTEFEIKQTRPNQRSKAYSLAANKAGHLIFSSTNAEDVRQTTIHDNVDADGKPHR